MTAGVELVASVGNRDWRFEPGQVVSVGREIDCDVVIEDRRVSRHHLRIEYRDGWVVQDLHSTGGAWLDGRRLGSQTLDGHHTVRLADQADGPCVTLEVTPTTHRNSSVKIGRALDNDIVLNDLLVSRYHARAEQSAGAWQLTDLGSRNPTLVNGTPVHGVATLADGDRLTVGGTELLVAGDEFRPATTGRASLVADNVGYTAPGGNTLLAGVHIDLGAGQLLAVVGPSGAGKSTLLKVLAGDLRPDTGSVEYDGYDVHDQYPAVRANIGVVPQEDVVHRKLTARTALHYAARLRLPSDTSADERSRRVEETLGELGMTGHGGTRIDRLSGGQRKRVSIALEMLTSPSLLMLDEPTSGLDQGLDRQVMNTLRSVADAGRTVVVVTHNVANLGQCDAVLLLAPGGIPVFLGPPSELHGRFGTSDWAEIFSRLVTGPGDVGAGGRPSTRRSARAVRQAGQQVTPALMGLGRQAGTLASRHLRLIVADPGYMLFLVLLPVVLAILALAVPGHDGLRGSVGGTATEANQLLVLIFVGAAFMGAAATAREVIGERPIYLRERAAGLRPAAYAVAKLGVFAMICAAQAALLVGIVSLAKPGPRQAVLLGHPLLEISCAVWCTAMAACLVSLLGSAVVRSNEQVMPLLVANVMAQLVFCGGLVPVTGRAGLSQLSWLMAARWGYAAGAATVNLRSLGRDVAADRLWTHAWPWWLLSVSVLLGIVLLCGTALVWRLRRLR
ncbi:MAG TPA: ATP-binding cassette domain-containing protein [Pseudonocardiaceae bacterium]|nr:ATP-binding cassette domain-containing protein [Pseudonocardiaceae bacterium]